MNGTTFRWKCVTILLLVVSATLLFFLCRLVGELHRIRCDIRLARNVVRSIDVERAYALQGDVARAIQYLRKFRRLDEANTRFDAHLMGIIALQKEAACREIIVYLRSKTGKDYGDDPEKWIEAFEAGTIPSGED
jgi:hypothetical protein